jgi:hypothetical protein
MKAKEIAIDSGLQYVYLGNIAWIFLRILLMLLKLLLKLIRTNIRTNIKNTITNINIIKII